MQSIRTCLNKVFCFPRHLHQASAQDASESIRNIYSTDLWNKSCSEIDGDGIVTMSPGSNLLFLAIVNGNKTVLTKLIASNLADNLDSADKCGRTALIHSVLSERIEICDMLLKASVDINKQDILGRTALHWAAIKGNSNCIKLLLSHGANVALKDNNGATSLHLSTKHKSSKCLTLLIKQVQVGVVDDQDCNKRTALHLASANGNISQIRLLIKHDSNVGIPDSSGRTPLHWAALCHHQEAADCVQSLTESSPSIINWQDYDGCTALHHAVGGGNLAVVQALVSVDKCNISSLDNQFRTPLHWAAALGHVQIASILLENKADYSSSDSNGATPLHYAAQYNTLETVKVILSYPGLKDEDIEGRTAFMWAASYGANDVIKFFMKNNVDVMATDKWGATVLHMAASAGHASTVSLFLSHGLAVDVVDNSKHTPLFCACQTGSMEVVQILIEHGAALEKQDQNGSCPLHWAALGGHGRICQLLLKCGVSANVKDSTGRTPLHCAAYNGSVNSLMVLLENKSEVNAQDNEGMTSLHWACRQGHLEVIKLLLRHDAQLNIMEYGEDRETDACKSAPGVVFLQAVVTEKVAMCCFRNPVCAALRNAEELVNKRYAPLDYALMNEYHEASQFLIEQGALSITGIQDLAAIKIQSWLKGVRVRKTFMGCKKLLMKHEQLRRCAAKKKAGVEETKDIICKQDST